MNDGPIDYEKYKIRRPGLYLWLFFIYLLVFSNTGSCNWREQHIAKSVEEIKAMQPCSQKGTP